MALDKTKLFQNLAAANTWVDPVPFKRINALPIEYYSLFKTKGEAAAYAYGIHKDTTVAYIGQIISVLNESVATTGETICNVEMYSIVNPNTDHDSDPTQALDYLLPIATIGNGTVIGSTYTTDEIDAMLAEIPRYMVFRGTIGESGTITELPLASADTNGDVYKVVSDGIVVNQDRTAKIGDTIICSQTGTGESAVYEWVLIPSGDEEGTVDTWREVKVKGETFLESSITTGPINFIERLDNPVGIEYSDENKEIGWYHKTFTTPTGSANTATQYITGFTTDGYGHITGFTYNTETPGFTAVTVMTPDGEVTIQSNTPEDLLLIRSSNDAITVTAESRYVAPIGTTYYDTQDLSNEAGRTEEEYEVTPVDENYSMITVNGVDYYINPLKNAIIISHKDRVGGALTTTNTGRTYIQNIITDAQGHIVSVTTAQEVDQQAFSTIRFVESDDNSEATSTTIELTPDKPIVIGKKLNLTQDAETGGIRIDHALAQDDDEGDGISIQGTTNNTVVTDAQIDKYGHVVNTTSKKLELAHEDANGDTPSYIGVRVQGSTGPVAKLERISTDILDNGANVLILDGNFN